MAISRNQLVKELEPGLNALFGLEYKNYENEHAEIYDTESSDRAFEEEVMLSGFAEAPVKTEEYNVLDAISELVGDSEEEAPAVADQAAKESEAAALKLAQEKAAQEEAEKEKIAQAKAQ